MKTNPSIGGSIWTYEDMTRLDIMITPERIYIFYSILLSTLSKYTFRLREETLKQFNTSRRSGNHEVMTGIIEKISFQIPLPFHFTTSNCFLLLALLSYFIFTTIYYHLFTNNHGSAAIWLDWNFLRILFCSSNLGVTCVCKGRRGRVKVKTKTCTIRVNKKTKIIIIINN